VARLAELQAALGRVEQRLAAACAAAGRPREDVVLVAVTKTWPASDCALLRDLGVRDLAENKDQEAARKAAEVEGVRWHFVGQLQTNKARSVASYADVVHSLDRPRLARALSDGAQRAGRELEVLVQVSLDGDPDRGGALPADVPALAEAAAGLPGLRLAGVMAVAPQGADPAAAFARLAEVAAALRADHSGATTVSAGMSGDLEQAVRAGATHVRVGTALLGGRPPPSG
jgi:PLP dependent protein